MSRILNQNFPLGPFALYWLHQQTAEFKTKYIRSMVNIAAPWGGAIKALRLMVSGDNIDVRLIAYFKNQSNLHFQGLRCFSTSCSSLSTFCSINCIRYAQC
jgi:hypothetical protein